jgi:hypothetical protein
MPTPGKIGISHKLLSRDDDRDLREGEREDREKND